MSEVKRYDLIYTRANHCLGIAEVDVEKGAWVMGYDYDILVKLYEELLAERDQLSQNLMRELGITEQDIYETMPEDCRE